MSGVLLLLLALTFGRRSPRQGAARWWSVSWALAGAACLLAAVAAPAWLPAQALQTALVQFSLVFLAAGASSWSLESGGKALGGVLMGVLAAGAGFTFAAVALGWTRADAAAGVFALAWTAVPAAASVSLVVRQLGSSSAPVRAQALSLLPGLGFGAGLFALWWMLLPLGPDLGVLGLPLSSVLGAGLLLRALRRFDPRFPPGQASPFVVEKTQDAVLFLRADGAVHAANPAIKSLLDWDEDGLHGRMLSTVGADEEARHLLVSLEQLTFPDWEGTMALANRTGRPVPVHVVFRRLHNPAREAVGAVLLLYDLRLPRHLDLSSREDQLTALSNRRWVLELLEAEFQRVKRYGGPLSALWVEVADLAAIEARFGAEASDDVLRRLGSILRGGLRRTDFCGRVGHREFLAVLPETPSDRAERVAVRLERMFALSEEGEPTGAALRIGWAALGEESPTSESFLNQLRAGVPTG